MAVNKVEVNGETKLDLTQDTVTPENLLSGATAHNAAGERISGAVAPVRYDVAQDLTSKQQWRRKTSISPALPTATPRPMTAASSLPSSGMPTRLRSPLLRR